MRQIFLACVCFILFTAAQAQTVPQANLLKQILDLPAPPPVEEGLSQAINNTVPNRERDFFSKSKIPPDDAPIGDLILYWSAQSQTYAQLRYNVKPSEKTLERILEYCEEYPAALSALINILPTKPEIAEIVKRLYDKLAEAENPDYSIYRIKNWLVYHSNFYVDELVKKAEKVKDKDEYVTNHTDLLALAEVDWDKALPIVEKLLNDKAQPVSATLAKWVFYSHAIKVDDDNDISKYRRLLQDAVEDRKLLPGARDLAFDALVSEQDWDGRDDWYLTLLSDETLFDLKVNGRSYTGLTTLLLYSPPEKYIKAMASLIDNKNPVIRRAAIKNLTTYLGDGNVEAVRALLPWLSNPNWASDIPNGRAMLITALGKVDLPESVPALITILMNEEENRYQSAEALARYKDPRAVPALKLALSNEKNPYRRNVFIRAMDECGGISDDEKMSSLELYATAISTPEGTLQLMNDIYRQVDADGKQQNPVPVALSIGNFVAEQIEPTDGLASRAVQRLKILRKTKPAVAAALAGIMQKWRGRIIFVERLRQIRDGEADLETILTALAQRKEIREKIENEVFSMRTSAGIGRGIAPCLSEDNLDFLSVLRQKDADAQAAMFGCARLLRVKLPVAEVGAFLKNANKTVALAAERYLESEDSVEARTIVLAQHQNEAVILGARYAFVPDPKNANYNDPLRQIFQNVMGRSAYFNSAFSDIDKNEAALRDEIKSNPDLMAVYGILPNKTAGQQVIRVFKDKIVFTNYEDEARYREKTLTAKEYEDFYRLILDEKVDASKPFFGYCPDCEASEPSEFVMFGKNGGRRVFATSALAENSPVKKIFERFMAFNEGKLKLHYRLADKIKGLEVLLADEKQVARSVWKNGNDLRVLVEDKNKEEEIQKNLEEQFESENSVEIDEEDYEQLQQRREAQEKRRQENKYAHFFWRGLENGTLGGVLTQPLEVPYLYDETQFPETSGFESDPRAWQVRAGNYEIRTSSEEGELYKVSNSQTPVKFKEGYYGSPIVTADGKWVIVTKLSENGGDYQTIARINLQTGKEFPVNLPPADNFDAIAFVASQNKVLVHREKRSPYYGYRQNQDEDEEEKPVAPDKDDKNPSPQTPEYYLLDAATGATQIVKGEFRPLETLTHRPLQAVVGAPDEFWAAIYDKKAKETAVGRYNTKTFAFQPVTKFPNIELDSMDIWVDEKEAKVYFVYSGHLLSAPLQKPQQ
jgi:hypothetical protein